MDEDLDLLEQQDIEEQDPRAWEHEEEDGIGGWWIAIYEGREMRLDEDPQNRKETV